MQVVVVVSRPQMPRSVELSCMHGKRKDNEEEHKWHPIQPFEKGHGFHNQ
jgi:hypothetical protein